MRSKEQAYEAEHAEMAALRRRESGISGAPTSSSEPNRRDTQPIRTVEKKKILQEKRQERERRKTQEISLMKRTPSHVSLIRHCN